MTIDYDALINQRYEEITKDYFDGDKVCYLYGKPIDRNNLKQMVVAAYHAGQKNEWERELESMKEVFDWSRV